jgi:bifunctional DNase/RNase
MTATRPNDGRRVKVKTKLSVRAQAALTRPTSEELLELFVFGMTMGTEGRRPVLILKDKTGNVVLPVWVNPIEISFAMNETAHQAHAAHSVAFKIMQTFGLKLERCVFDSIKGIHQYVRLEFSGNEKLTQLEARADDAMSLCLASAARFFAPASFINQAREVDAELLGIESGMLKAPEIGFRNHKYVM